MEACVSNMAIARLAAKGYAPIIDIDTAHGEPKLITNTKKMQYWLMQSDYTSVELADEVGCSSSQCYKVMRRWVAQGLVEVVAWSKNASGQSMARYTWCGDDNLITASLRAAKYLRDEVGSDEAKQIARKIFECAENGL